MVRETQTKLPIDTSTENRDISLNMFRDHLRNPSFKDCSKKALSGKSSCSKQAAADALKNEPYTTQTEKKNFSACVDEPGNMPESRITMASETTWLRSKTRVGRSGMAKLAGFFVIVFVITLLVAVATQLLTRSFVWAPPSKTASSDVYPRRLLFSAKPSNGVT
eukprot:g48224.t1